MEESRVVTFPKGRRRPLAKTGDEKMTADIRKAYQTLCKKIDAATKAGLEIKCYLDSSDTWGEGRIRSKEVIVSRKL